MFFSLLLCISFSLRLLKCEDAFSIRREPYSSLFSSLSFLRASLSIVLPPPPCLSTSLDHVTLGQPLVGSGRAAHPLMPTSDWATHHASPSPQATCGDLHLSSVYPESEREEDVLSSTSYLVCVWCGVIHSSTSTVFLTPRLTKNDHDPVFKNKLV